MSAVCPHLSCLVRWDKTEKQWSCPCHDSSFIAKGDCIQGPATSDLSPLDSADW
jgi:Rieske Fe-S protein